MTQGPVLARVYKNYTQFSGCAFETNLKVPAGGSNNTQASGEPDLSLKGSVEAFSCFYGCKGRLGRVGAMPVEISGAECFKCTGWPFTASLQHIVPLHEEQTQYCVT